jgi:hypothetical protein
MGEFRLISAIFVGKRNNEVTLLCQRFIAKARSYFGFDLVDHLGLERYVILRKIDLASSVRQERKRDDQKKDAGVDRHELAGYVFLGKRSSANAPFCFHRNPSAIG